MAQKETQLPLPIGEDPLQVAERENETHPSQDKPKEASAKKRPPRKRIKK
ncbi:MAG: hypothetical protein U0X91_11085 [Spirosomataceae bacterium]